MRTTVTIDPDTEELLRREMARARVSFKRALNDAIRRGLAPAHPAGREPVDVLPFRSAYRPGIDRARLQQLADEMDIDEAAPGAVPPR